MEPMSTTPRSSSSASRRVKDKMLSMDRRCKFWPGKHDLCSFFAVVSNTDRNFSRFTYSTLIWALKATMLFFFNRLTSGLGHQKFVKWLGAVVATSYVAVFLTILLGCYPTNKNWQIIPDPGSKCTVRLQNLYVVTLLNVVTDAAILCIPLPLLWRLKVSISKKLSLGLLLSSGLFVITAAIIRLVLTLKGSASATTLNRWGVRETIVGIVAVNIPILRPRKSQAQAVFYLSRRPQAEFFRSVHQSILELVVQRFGKYSSGRVRPIIRSLLKAVQLHTIQSVLECKSNRQNRIDVQPQYPCDKITSWRTCWGSLRHGARRNSCGHLKPRFHNIQRG